MANVMKMFYLPRFLYLVIILAKESSSFRTSSSGCLISLSNLPPIQPVFLLSILISNSSSSLDDLPKYELLKPQGEETILDVGTRLRLYCPGTNNIIESLGKNSIELICNTYNSFESMNGEIYSLENLSCKAIPGADLRLTSIKCGGNKYSGLIYEAGFNTDGDNFVKVFTICYNSTNEDTLYTHNIINGAAIKFAFQEKTRRGFRANGMNFPTGLVNKFYTIDNQIKRFNKYFGDQQNYIDKQMFLARGHLTPDADFIFGYEQLSTYFYTNVAPEFQIINAGNWLRVENLARSLAAGFKSDLDIYNGYMGQLQLLHPRTGEGIDIFLDDTKKIEVPEYYFKVIKHEPSNSAIVMITINNPFAAELGKKEFCNNVCGKAGLQQKYFSDESRGYTFCCELKEFKKFYNNLPKKLTAKRLLVKALTKKNYN